MNKLKIGFTILAALVISSCSGGGGSNTTTAPFVTLTNGQAASVVIGQADFVSDGVNQEGSVDANTLFAPDGNATVYNSVLYFSDYNNNRVLGFNTIPTIDNTHADFVLGQVDFTSSSGGTLADKFKNPTTIVSVDGKLVLVDKVNNRVLMWNTVPTSNVAADIVLGQANMTSSSTGCSLTLLNNPYAVTIAGSKLVISDSDNNRVLIYNSVPSVSGASPDVVIGQGDFTKCTANDDNQDNAADPQPSARTLNTPMGVWTDGVRLVVSDSINNRLLVWNSFPTSNFQSADIVLAQVDFTTTATTITSSSLNTPFGVYSNGTQLVVADNGNSRVLLWNQFPTTNNESADVVLGQVNFTLGECNDSDGNGVLDNPSATSMCYPTGVLLSGNQLLVGEDSNNRYLIYNSQ